MRIATESRDVEVTLRVWNGSNWGCDCFQDLECNFAQDHEVDDETGDIACTEEELNDLISFWEGEVEDVNAGKYSEVLSLTEEELEEGCEWSLEVA